MAVGQAAETIGDQGGARVASGWDLLFGSVPCVVAPFPQPIPHPLMFSGLDPG